MTSARQAIRFDLILYSYRDKESGTKIPVGHVIILVKSEPQLYFIIFLFLLWIALFLK